MPTEPTVKRAVAFLDAQNRLYAADTSGINKTDWVRVGCDSYDRSLDTRDYRPKGTT